MAEKIHNAKLEFDKGREDRPIYNATPEAPAWAEFTQSSSKDGGWGYRGGCNSQATAHDADRAVLLAGDMFKAALERMKGLRADMERAT